MVGYRSQLNGCILNCLSKYPEISNNILTNKIIILVGSPKHKMLH